MADILKDLNEEQRKAVECTGGPVMVIAGAGSGKTRVLTYRVAHLLTLGVDPFNILALTFTNKAAREMKERILTLVGDTNAQGVWMGTFHSIFARVLRIDGHRLGYPSNFTIYDTEDSKRVIRNLVKDNNLDEKIYPAGYILHRISAAKTSLISPAEYNESPELRDYDSGAGKPFTGQIYTQYQSKLFRASAMDFDDLLFNMNLLLRDYPDVLYKYQQKFRYVLVDEYQDTNYAQYLIVKALAANNENICVVGDDAQSIYAFRGANIQNILNFKRDYPDLKTFKLEQNYRSTKTIVAAANCIIANNKQQIFKEIWTENDEGSRITLIRSSTDGEESQLVSQSIFENRMNERLPNAAFAILYRTNAQSRSLEEALRRMNIPCRIYGGLSFYQRKEIKDLLAYFRLVANPKDEDALLRIINYPPRGIGKTTIEKLIVASDKYKKNLFEILSDPSSYPVPMSESTWSKLNIFTTMIRSLQIRLSKQPAFEMAREIATSSGLLKELYDDKTPEGVSRFENIEELLNAIKEFTEKKGNPTNDPLFQSDPELATESDGSHSEATGKVRTLDQFMQDIALLTDQDSGDDEDDDRVLLMTIHSAKGLEFPYVYVVGLEENLFPSSQSLSSRSDLEEERRLFYVAVTRAQHKLTLSYAENRYRWGNLTSNEPSRFLQEIPEKHLDLPTKPASRQKEYGNGENFSSILLGIRPPKPEPVNLKNFRKLNSVPTGTPSGGSDEEIQTGMEVEHERFGKGKVVAIEGSGPNKKATVFFPGIGQKQLLLRFARLKIVKDGV